MSRNVPVRKRRIFYEKRSIFRHFAWEREEMIPKWHQISQILCLFCLQAACKIWSRSEHVLGLNYVLLSNLQNRKFDQYPLKISLLKNTSFTHWLITRRSVMIQLWFIPHPIAYHLPKKMRYQWTKSDKEWKQGVKSKTMIKNTACIMI